MKISKERKNELKAIALELIEEHDIDSWDYTEHWDGLVECDEVMTSDEWEWLANTYRIKAETVTVAKLVRIKK